MDDDRAPRPDARPHRPGPPGPQQAPGPHPFPGAYPPPSAGPHPFPGAYPAPGQHPASGPRSAAPGPALAAGPFPAPQPPRGPEPAGAELGWQQPIGSPARFVASALLVVVAATQLLAVNGPFGQGGGSGILPAALAVGAVAAAGVLAWRDSRLAWLLAGGIGQLTLLGYVLGHSMGLPGSDDAVGRWAEPVGLLSAISATVVLALAGWAVAQDRPALRWARSRSPFVAGLVALQLSAVATFAVTSLPYGEAQLGTHGGLHTGSDTSSYWSAVDGAPYRPTGVTRTYYIAAVEVVWDYAPLGKDGAANAPFGDAANVFVRSGPGRIGSKYLKCLYRRYTDASFSTQAQRTGDEASLGMWGPVVRAAVGDSIKIVFRNNCSVPASVHPHGVFYQKASEGAPYADNTTGKDVRDDAVRKGGSHTYTWLVTERAGPGPHDGSSVMWMYHSHVDEVADTYAGLMGPMIITAAAMARPDGTPKDVDQEVLQLYTVENENLSHYLPKNLDRFAERPFPRDLEDEDFVESNLMHSINGYVYGNVPMVTVHKGQRVRWYVMSMGTEVDIHTPHWHANTVLAGGMRMDTVSLLPAGMVVADMVPDNVGIWLFHCHVNDHLTAGMTGRYRVAP